MAAVAIDRRAGSEGVGASTNRDGHGGSGGGLTPQSKTYTDDAVTGKMLGARDSDDAVTSSSLPLNTVDSQSIASQLDTDVARRERHLQSASDTSQASASLGHRQGEASLPVDGVTSTSRRPRDYLGEDELIALIVEIKLQADGAGRGKAAPGHSSSSARGAVAPSPDTIDLCHRKIHTMPDGVVDVIKDDLVRLALGYNFISSLPASFVDLKRLRYLNVRANYLTSIPDVITQLPALEILDISRNKIRSLPSEPKRLLELRVLSISSNRLKRLPAWLADVKHLRILKIESNPIVWPPPEITTLPSTDTSTTKGEEGGNGSKQAALKRAEDRQMTAWIVSLKRWLADHASEAQTEGQNSVAKLAAPPAISLDTHLGSSTSAPSSIAGLTDENDSLRIPPSRSALSAIEEVSVADTEEYSRTPIADHNEDSTTVEAADEDHDSRDLAAQRENMDAKVDSRESKEQPFQEVGMEGEEPISGTDCLAAPAASTDEGTEEEQRKGHTEAQPSSQDTVTPAKELSSQEYQKAERVMPDKGLIEQGNAKDDGIHAALHESLIETESTSDALQTKITHLPEQPPTTTTDPSMAIAEDLSKTHTDNTITGPVDIDKSIAHSRNNSHSIAPPLTPQRMSRAGLMRSKKSLPDLRQSHGAILMDRRAESEIIHEDEDEDGGSGAESADVPSRATVPTASTPVRARGNSDATQWKAVSKQISNVALDGEPNLAEYWRNRAQGGKGNLGTAVPTTATAIESERNSYFKRLSTLPASSISKSISVPVLKCIDATRGVLYALSQVHTALKHYVTFATDERMTSQLSRVLDIAGGSMANLIHALDRFDSLSRMKGGTLDPVVVRGVLSSCIESIATFRKLIHVVHVQLKSLQTGADARYSRTLLLLLYGSLGEITMSWSIMEPLLEEVAVYLCADVPAHHSTRAAPNLPSIAESTSPTTPASARPTAPPSRPQRRRHAGSFSAKDVAHGANMNASLQSTPSSEIEEGRKLHRPPALTSVSEPRLLNYQAVQGAIGSASGVTRHAQGDENDIQASSNQNTATQWAPGNDGTSHTTLANKSGVPSQAFGMYGQIVEATSLPIDDHLLSLVVKITSIAFSVWAGIQEHLYSLGLPIPSSSSSRSQIASGEQSLGNTTAESTSAKVPRDRHMIRETSETSLRGAGSTAGNEFDASLPDARSFGNNGDAAAQNANTSQRISPTVQRRLRQLYDLVRGVEEHTHRLEACLERAQDAMSMTPMSFNSPPMVPGPMTGLSSSSSSAVSFTRNGQRGGSDTGTSISGEGRDGAQQQSNQGSGAGVGDTSKQSNGKPKQTSSARSEGARFTPPGPKAASEASRELFSESGLFIKSVLQISQYIKGLAADGLVLPKHVKATLAELTTCARDLTLHLHFLSGPTPLQMPTSSSNVSATLASARTHNAGGIQHGQFPPHRHEKVRTAHGLPNYGPNQARSGPSSAVSAPPASYNPAHR